MLTFIKILITPIFLVFCFSITAAALKKNKPKSSNLFFAITAISFLLFSTAPIPQLLLSQLEQSYQPLTDLKAIQADSVHIVVLGGGHNSNKAFPANDQLYEATLGRLIEGIRIHLALPGSQLICSGGKGSQPDSQAEVQKRTAVSLGVKEEDVFLLPTTVNTRHEAEEYHKRFGSKHPLILVTDASHMPRAMYAFQQQGLNPIAAPTNHAIKDMANFSWRSLIPNTTNLSNADRAIYEYLGQLWYAVAN